MAFRPDYTPLMMGAQAQAQALSGLGGLGAQMIEAKRSREAAEAANTEIQEAMASGNAGQIAQVSMKYPQLSQQIERSMGFVSEATKQNAIDTYSKIVSNPQMTEQYLQDRASFVLEHGGNPNIALRDIELYKQDPEGYIKTVEPMLAAASPDAWKAASEMRKKPEPTKGLYQYKDTPTGFVKFNTATGDAQEVSLDSKEGQMIRQRKLEDLDAEVKADGEVFKKAEKLRGEYNKKASEFFDVRSAYDRVLASAESPDPAGDIALIFNYMKMLDPGSVVREGEFATAQTAGSVPDNVWNQYNRLLTGERLSENRQMFVDRASKLYAKAAERNTKDKDEILGIGRRYGITETDIFGVQDQVQEESPAQQQQYPTVTTQAEFDALPSGAVYMSNGVPHRKP